PWGKLDIDMVIESTGAFITYEKAKAHIEAGAKKVVVTAPMKDDTTTIVLGVNDEKLSGDLDIVSNASCTTNCIAPPIKIIDEAFGIKRLLVNSVHAFTATQNILDNKCKEGNDLRKARAATLSMIPTKTGAVKACAVIFPHLKGKLDGMAFRVPVPTVSCAYMAFFLKTETTREEVIAKLKEASEGSMKNILSVTQEELVSIDYQTDPHSSIVDEEFTKVVDGKALQLLAWYDNEWGYAMRVTELVQKLSKLK
ncbi:MAG: aldehyde dehydrogenase, partial [Candidatus Peribacteraceae bacterium]|nr:aldehyde dehydrogenase [Candidatus Peribacteraceae bacterium]